MKITTLKSILKITFVFVFLFSLSANCFADTKGPSSTLKSINDKMMALSKNTTKNKARILKLVGRLIDFNSLCKDSLRKHWDKKTQSERDNFTRILQALIEKNLINRLESTSNHKIEYISEKINGKSSSVITTVKDSTDTRSDEIEIEYKMKKNNNSWKVIDMVTDGISMVSNYRSQFNKIIKKDGWDALIKKMNDKLAEK